MKKIDKKQIVASISRSNPWWVDNGSSFSSRYKLFDQFPKRTHYAKILEQVQKKNPNRAFVLMGPRRVGKTVILYQIISHLLSNSNMIRMNNKILFASLDNPIFRLSSLEEIVLWGFESTQTSLDQAYVFLDEIQYIENWEQQLKVLVDNYPQVKFIVTGSATAALNKKSKESGAGRFTDYMLPPLSFYEFMVIKVQLEKTPKSSVNIENLNDLYIDYLNYGGFPESFTSQNIKDFPEQYIGQDILDKVLMRDLPSVFGITNPNELNRLFTALAYNSSNEISLESISQTSGVSKKDIYKYIDYLEAAFLIKTIDKTDNKTQQFQRRTFFKVILSNPSLRSAIFGKVNGLSPELEGLAETAIFSQLVIHFWHSGFYKYARWNRGNKKGEVDLVHVDKKGTPLSALEIKWTDRFALGNEDPKSLINYCKENLLKEGFATTKSIFTKKTYGGITVYYLPVSFLCLLIGCSLHLRDEAKVLLSTLIESYFKNENFSELKNDKLIPFIQLAENISFLNINLIKEHLAEGLKIASAILAVEKKD